MVVAAASNVLVRTWSSLTRHCTVFVSHLELDLIIPSPHLFHGEWAYVAGGNIAFVSVAFVVAALTCVEKTYEKAAFGEDNEIFLGQPLKMV